MAKKVTVNAAALAPSNSYGVPDFVSRGYYVDLPFQCKDCGKKENWTAAQQKWWYEVAKGFVYSTAVRCRACRRRRSGIAVEELALGDGAVAEHGSTVKIRYSGFLSRGERFQADIEVSFCIGRRQVIAGLEYGVEGMRVGGRRRLQVSPHLAYREQGVPGVIPPNAKLIFEVELLAERHQ